ncbi:NAD(P)H-dependent glycerol-3-phosphate dehydrogenase [Brevifollis gellanilyticus]|uniref:Glycerol-3-phosphate dehydrogenase [NAD(P)+] n=1 Tax=Brevifollis gellanilyticus TaxID=748831 RepID=A0A512M8X6_9BACT|nr:NAD(P)H-dependent glycerol-3-phosphate dehydrogenase [Brevifollis gellanilyticus]GEP42811.1 glycerol-3-phosphate dehydrogenase [NAD(P)+] [Brevifollis gellanilyticus]
MLPGTKGSMPTTQPPSYQSAIVFGAGSWGTGLASTLHERGLQVQFWGRDEALMSEIRQTRRNSRYLPSQHLPEGITITSDLASLKPADMLLLVVPSKGIRDTAAAIAATGLQASAKVVVSCAKGIELRSGKRMSEILAESLPGPQHAVLTGPNHAEEVAQRLATAAVVACADEETARAVQSCFTLPWFRSYTSDDVAGVEWAGAMKNPYAIAAGIALGLKLGDNAIAALVTRALAEMVRMIAVMGGRPETCYGLAGVGDLIATCYSEHSRNHRVGKLLGEGMSLADIIASTRMVAEGVPNTASLYEAAQARDVRAPLLAEIYAILHEGKPAREAMRDLLSRDPRSETDQTR